MHFPFSISDFGLWLALMAIILLVTAELVIAYSASTKISFLIDKKRFHYVAGIMGIFFIFTVILRLVGII